MRRRTTVGLIVFAVIAVPAIALIWTQVRPLYRAMAEVRVRPIIPRLVFETDDNGPIPFYDSFVNNQISILKSPTVLGRVLDQPEVRETQWFKECHSSKPEFLGHIALPHLDRLKQQLQAERREKTEILEVALLDPNAKDATVIVNAVLEQYTCYIRDAVNTEDDRLYTQLLEKKKSLGDKIAGQEKLLARLEQQLDAVNPDEWLTAKRFDVKETEDRLNQLRQDIAILEWEMQQANGRKGDNADAPSAVADKKQPPYHEDVEWRQFYFDVLRREHEIERNPHGPNHPDTVAAQADLDFARKLLRLREKQLDETWETRQQVVKTAGLNPGDPNQPVHATEPESIRHQLARAKMQEESLHKELQEQKDEFGRLFEIVQLIEAESRDLEHDRELYDVVRQRINEKNMERNVASPIEVLSSAVAPSEPDRDRRILFTGIALSVALIPAFVAALLAKRRRPAEPIQN